MNPFWPWVFWWRVTIIVTAPPPRARVVKRENNVIYLEFKR